MDQRPTDPMDPQPPNAGGPAPEERRFGEAPAMAAKWLADLQAIVDNLANQSAPVIREVGAKAAEVAAIAAERAGPLAQRAADATQDIGARLAIRSRDLAAELRRATAPEAAGAAAAWPNDSAGQPPSGADHDSEPAGGPGPSA